MQGGHCIALHRLCYPVNFSLYGCSFWDFVPGTCHMVLLMCGWHGGVFHAPLLLLQCFSFQRTSWNYHLPVLLDPVLIHHPVQQSLHRPWLAAYVFSMLAGKRPQKEWQFEPQGMYCTGQISTRWWVALWVRTSTSDWKLASSNSTGQQGDSTVGPSSSNCVTLRIKAYKINKHKLHC